MNPNHIAGLVNHRPSRIIGDWEDPLPWRSALFDDWQWKWFAVFEYFSQNGCVTWILDIGIDGIFDEIEKGFEVGITIAFGGLFCSIGELTMKGGSRYLRTKNRKDWHLKCLPRCYLIKRMIGLSMHGINLQRNAILTNTAGHRLMK